MASSIISTPCLRCGTEVTLTSPRGNSQACPSGKCPKCGQFYYVSYDLDDNVQVNAYSGHPIRKREGEHG